MSIFFLLTAHNFSSAILVSFNVVPKVGISPFCVCFSNVHILLNLVSPTTTPSYIFDFEWWLLGVSACSGQLENFVSNKS